MQFLPHQSQTSPEFTVLHPLGDMPTQTGMPPEGFFFASGGFGEWGGGVVWEGAAVSGFQKNSHYRNRRAA